MMSDFLEESLDAGKPTIILGVCCIGSEFSGLEDDL